MEKKEKDKSNVTTSVNYGVVSFSSWFKSICTPKTDITKSIKVPTIFKSEHLERQWTSQFAPISLKGKPLGSHMVGSKYPVHPDVLDYDWWTVGGKVLEPKSDTLENLSYFKHAKQLAIFFKTNVQISKPIHNLKMQPTKFRKVALRNEPYTLHLRGFIDVELLNEYHNLQLKFCYNTKLTQGKQPR